MILSERELELGTDHAGIMVLAEGPSRGRRSPTCCRSPTDPGRRADGQPGRPALGLRHRARGGGALRPGARAAPGRRSRAATATRRSTFAIEDLEGCPRYIGRRSATSRWGPRRPGSARGSPAPGCARSRTSSTSRTTSCSRSATRCTPSTAPRSRAAGSSCAARRRGEKLRTLDGVERELDERGPRDRRRRARRSRSPGSWAARRPRCGDATTERPARGGELRAVRRCCGARERLQAADRGLESLGEGGRSVSRAAGGVVRDAAARRARRRALARPQRRPRRAAAAAPSCGSGLSAPTS